ncbi:MAG: class I SAM-dependent methyltransferase [Acidobacteriota bacterium]
MTNRASGASNPPAPATLKEWNAAVYHRVSGPQTEWGRRVLTRLDLKGDEHVIDAGCGTGRLTGELLARLPRGRMVAIDRSWNMLITARANLRPQIADRVAFVRVELPLLPFRSCADLVFSTATFHWVLDHPALFEGILRVLRPGGRLFAQCGGGPNLAHARALAAGVMGRAPFAEYFADWTGVWEYADAEVTAERLSAAGFADVSTSLEETPTSLVDESSYREFVSTVIYHVHLSRLPEGSLRARFIDEVTALAAREDPPFTLDYWRLNLEGRRP